MAIYYLNVKTVSRSQGRSVVAAAAYCSKSRLRDDRLGYECDFSGSGDVVYSEILLPQNAPERWSNREIFWNEVEAIEVRKDSALAREIEIVIPSELSREQGISLARHYLLDYFVGLGMVVDFNIHLSECADGRARAFVHALLSMREIEGDGFGRKRSDWKAKDVLLKWRKLWMSLANRSLADAGRKERIDDRANSVRGRGLEPPRVGWFEDASAVDAETAWRNGERIIAEPELALEALVQITRSFSRGDLEHFVKERTADEEQFLVALGRVELSPGILRLGIAVDGVECFSTRTASSLMRSDVAAEVRSLADGGGLSIGAGALSDAAKAWEAEGLRMRGVGLTYDLAKAFQKKTGIKSVAVHGILGRWKKKEDLLEARDVLVVNDVGKLSEKQKKWMLAAARAVRAKLVLIDGDRLKVVDGARIGLDAEAFEMLAAE